MKAIHIVYIFLFIVLTASGLMGYQYFALNYEINKKENSVDVAQQIDKTEVALMTPTAAVPVTPTEKIIINFPTPLSNYAPGVGADVAMGLYINKMLPLMEEYAGIVTNLNVVTGYINQGNFSAAANFFDTNSVKLNNIFSSAQRISAPDEAQLAHSYFMNGINELRLYFDLGSAVVKYGSLDQQTWGAIDQMEIHGKAAEDQSLKAFNTLQELAGKYNL